MKRLLSLVLLLLLPVAVFNQNIDIDDPETITPLLREFRSEAIKRGIFIDGHIAKHLGGIKKVSSEELERSFRSDNGEDCNCLGMLGRRVSNDFYNYSYIVPYIYIREDIYSHPQALRMVLFHEIGHLYGLDHTGGIMFYGISVKQIYTDEEWKMFLDYFFEELRAALPSKYWKRSDNTEY